MDVEFTEELAEIIIALSVFLSSIVYCYINCCKKNIDIEEPPV